MKYFAVFYLAGCNLSIWNLLWSSKDPNWSKWKFLSPGITSDDFPEGVKGFSDGLSSLYLWMRYFCSSKSAILGCMFVFSLSVQPYGFLLGGESSLLHLCSYFGPHPAAPNHFKLWNRVGCDPLTSSQCTAALFGTAKRRAELALRLQTPSWRSTKKSQKLLQVVPHLTIPLLLLDSYFGLTSKTDFIKSFSAQNPLSSSFVPLPLPNQLAQERFGHGFQLERVVLSHCISSVGEWAQGRSQSPVISLGPSHPFAVCPHIASQVWHPQYSLS